MHNPVLPKWLTEVSVTNLRVGRSTMNLRFRREGSQTSFSVRDKQGGGAHRGRRMSGRAAQDSRRAPAKPRVRQSLLTAGACR